MGKVNWSVNWNIWAVLRITVHLNYVFTNKSIPQLCAPWKWIFDFYDAKNPIINIWKIGKIGTIQTHTKSTGKVRVWYGFGTGWGYPRYWDKPEVFREIVRVSTGLVRVRYGFGTGSGQTRTFFQKSNIKPCESIQFYLKSWKPLGPESF